MLLIGLFYREPRLHPTLFPLRIVRDVVVAHGRQSTGGVFTGVSMGVGAVGNNSGIFVRQQLRGKFVDSVGRYVHGAGKMSFPVAFRD